MRRKFLIILSASILMAAIFSGCAGGARQPGAETAPAPGTVIIPAKAGAKPEQAPQEGQPERQPVERHGSNLELPPGFPSSLVPIAENADITDTYEDGISFSVTYQTDGAFSDVVKLYQRSMEDAKIIMEDTQKGAFYTINGTKEQNNIFITVMKYSQDSTMVVINTNTSDMSAIEEGKAMRQAWSAIPNEADFTPIVLIDPITYAPPPTELEVENQTIKAVSDGMIINVYANEKPSDFEKIPNEVIFKFKPVPSDSHSPYRDGDAIPVIYNMVDGENLRSDLTVAGMVDFGGNRYSLAEQTCTIALPQDGHTYAPGSSEIKIQVYLPHKGDEYWLIVWNAREIHSINMPKYLIQSEGLDAITEGIYAEEG